MITGFGWRRERSRNRRAFSNKNFSSKRFCRVGAEVQVDATQTLVIGRIFLNDLRANAVSLFLQEPIARFQDVSLVIHHPKYLFVRGRIVGCVPYTMSAKIVSSDSFMYRAVVEFYFEDAAERKRVQQYVDTLFDSES